MPELRLGFRGCSAAPIWSRALKHMTYARSMTSHSESSHVHYNHTDACQFTRWNARESYHFMYAARSWKKVNDFYSQLVLGNVSFSDIFKTPMHIVHHEADLLDTSVQTESTTSPTIKRTGRWARVTFKIVLSYNGGSFDGWQKQPGLNTVQGSVERSLGKFIDEKKLLLLKDKGLPIEGCVVVAGRTDKGVAAYQQVCSFFTWRKDIKAEDIEEAVNDAEPGKLRVISVSEVSRAFHPNFSAKWRRYIYVFPLNTEKEESSQHEDTVDDVFDGGKRNVDDVYMALENPDVLADNYSSETRNVKKSNGFSVKKVDLLLRQLEGKLLSYKMFARDTKASRNIGPPTECFLFHARATEVRLISDAEDQEGTEAMCIELVANRFLRKMVRVLVATAIREAAAGAEDDALVKLVDATCRRATAPPAPADGLCLFDVGYTDFNPKVCLIL
ncbi:uncharacterized protein LOC141708398 [Apium graveolens]|uniref:uncharacterized protein LOC141708398 n=1 Tax=Apium graveolens TaxID=4045 RepID=UPI003D7BD706